MSEQVFRLKNILAILLELPEGVSHLSKELFDLPHRRYLLNVLSLALQEGLSHKLDPILLLWCVRIVLDSASAGQGVVHLELLLELSDLSLVLLEEERRVLKLVHDCLVLDFHHS